MFNTVCAIGTNGLAFLLPVEFTPLQTRGKSVAISTGFFWLFNFFVVMISPVLISRIKYGTYILWAATNLCFIPLIYFLCKWSLDIGPYSPLEQLFFTLEDFAYSYFQCRKPAKLHSRTLMSCLRLVPHGLLVRVQRRSSQTSSSLGQRFVMQIYMFEKEVQLQSTWWKTHRHNSISGVASIFE